MTSLAPASTDTRVAHFFVHLHLFFCTSLSAPVLFSYSVTRLRRAKHDVNEERSSHAAVYKTPFFIPYVKYNVCNKAVTFIFIQRHTHISQQG